MSASWQGTARLNDRGAQAQVLLLSLTLDDDGMAADREDLGVAKAFADLEVLPVDHSAGATGAPEDGLQLQSSDLLHWRIDVRPGGRRLRGIQSEGRCGSK